VVVAVGQAQGIAPAIGGRKRRLRLSVPAPRPRFRSTTAAKRSGSHQSAQGVDEGIGRRKAWEEAIDGHSAFAGQAVGVTQGVVEGIGRGLVTPAGETRHSAKPNALFLWGGRPPPAGGRRGRRPASGGLASEGTQREAGARGNRERGASVNEGRRRRPVSYSGLAGASIASNGLCPLWILRASRSMTERKRAAEKRRRGEKAGALRGAPRNGAGGLGIRERGNGFKPFARKRKPVWEGNEARG